MGSVTRRLENIFFTLIKYAGTCFSRYKVLYTNCSDAKEFCWKGILLQKGGHKTLNIADSYLYKLYLSVLLSVLMNVRTMHYNLEATISWPIFLFFQKRIFHGKQML